ncbi:MAG: carbohydrate ABC transporter permease, partial [Nostocoides sp.]
MTVSGPVAESLAGRGAGKVAARRNRGGAAGRVGWPTYLILGVVLLLSAYPLYYSFLLGSSDAATIA